MFDIGNLDPDTCTCGATRSGDYYGTVLADGSTIWEKADRKGRHCK